jgi:hypothetical protein
MIAPMARPMASTGVIFFSSLVYLCFFDIYGGRIGMGK